MEKVNSKKYGIIRRSEEAYVAKKMGISESNIYNISRCDEVLGIISAGDILCVPSVKSFAVSSYDLFRKMQYLLNRGIEFQSATEKYLNFSSIKPISLSTEDTLKNFAQREYEFVEWIKTSTLNQKTKAHLINKIQWESLIDIVVVFSNNGIKKR